MPRIGFFVAIRTIQLVATKAFCLFVLALLFSVPTKAQQIIIVRGVVVDSATQKPLNKTTVIRLSDNSVFFTDSLGRFDITCTRNDAVRFSFVGYKTLRLVVINVPDSASGYKKFLRIEMPVDKRALQQIVIQGERPEKEDTAYYARALKPIEASLLQSPITAIYAEFSKKEKEKKQLQQILQTHYLNDLYRYRLPTSRLYTITGDKSFTPEILQRSCPLSEFFLLNASDYELYNYAKRCHERHKNKLYGED
ncbi:MAG TPA: hypothetical protein VEY71_08160 [Chitinophagales bacterium]|nr:hypothetical protein [Chitinophagales bacterium]